MVERDDKSHGQRGNTSGIGSTILSFFRSKSNQNSEQERQEEQPQQEEGQQREQSSTPDVDDEFRPIAIPSLKINKQRKSTFNNISDIYSKLRAQDELHSSTQNEINESEINNDNNKDILSKYQDLINNSDDMDTEEFAPLYQDNEGNLVRPPYINLDPRERYHLLQLKKSVELSDSIERQMRYMVNPNETKSAIVGNKVETSTQTHDIDYLKSSLRFSRKRKPLEQVLPSSKKTKKRGFFGGNFSYDLTAIEEKENRKKTTHKLDGYLGSISEPSFKKTTEPTKKVNVDDAKIFSKFGNISNNPTSKRYGLDESLLNNTKIKTTLDPSYVQRTEKLSNILKVKEVPTNERDNTTKPSAGFQFNISKDNVDKIINTRIENENLVNATTNPATLNKPVTEKSNGGLFGNNKTNHSTTNPSNSDTPLFSFGSKPNTLKRSVMIEESGENFEAANSLFKPTEPKAVSLINSKVDKPANSLLFGDAQKSDLSKKRSEPEDDEPNAKRPTFLFSKPDASSDSTPKLFGSTAPSKPFLFNPPSNSTTSTQDRPAPLFSFSKKDDGKSTDSVSDASKSTEKGTTPLFTFGSKPTDKKDDNVTKPAFSFSAPTSNEKKQDETTAADKPSFSISAKPANGDSSKPAFSFGSTSTSTEKKDTTEKPAFSFGSTTTQEKDTAAKPAFTFGSTTTTENKSTPSKPAFTFGASSTTQTKDSASKPAFSFGTGATATVDPASIFGATPSSTTETSKPAFTFGSTPTAAKVSTASTNSTPAPVNKETSKPVFSFGGSTTTSGADTGTKPAFNFGSAPTNNAFSFGANPSTKSQESTPFGFANGSKETTPTNAFKLAPGANAFGNSSSGFNANNSQTNFSNGNNNFANPTGGNSNAPFGNSFSNPSSTGFNFGSANSSRQGTPFGNTFQPSVNNQNIPFQTQQPISQPQPFAQGSGSGFNFTGVSREGTPNPSQIFGNSQPQFGGTPTPTPPIVPPGRIIAKMRKRRN